MFSIQTILVPVDFSDKDLQRNQARHAAQRRFWSRVRIYGYLTLIALLGWIGHILYQCQLQEQNCRGLAKVMFGFFKFLGRTLT